MTSSIATTAFIANTDFGWFSHFLHRAERPDEVNFWQPSPKGFKAISTGTPFFFRLSDDACRSSIPATLYDGNRMLQRPGEVLVAR